MEDSTSGVGETFPDTRYPSSMLTLADVVQATGGRLLGHGPTDLALSGVRLDSRRVEPGDLFVALDGPKHDGHAFVAEAFAQGARAALVTRVPPECPWAEDPTLDGPPLVLVDDTTTALHRTAAARRAAQPARVVAIAGSVAAGTARELVAAVLGGLGPLVESDGALDPSYGVPLALLGLDARHRYAIVELTGRGGEAEAGPIRGLAEIARPDVGVVMNVDPSGGGGDAVGEPGPRPDAEARALELLAALPAGGTAVLNADDERVRAMAARTAAQTIFFGLGPNAEVFAIDVAGRGLGGTEFVLQFDGHSVRVVLPLIGHRSVHAALAAAAVGLTEGMAISAVAEGLVRASSSLRVVVARGVNGARIVDDTYDADVESTMAALNLLSELEGRKVAVLGDLLGLGRHEEAAHIKVGSRAARIADLLVTVGPRAATAAGEARRVGLDPSAVVETADHEAAVGELKRRLRPGDTVLVTGSRGMEMERVIAEIRVEG